MRRVIVACAIVVLAAGAAPARAGGASGLVRRAQQKLAAGTLVPETDLAPLVAALERTKSGDEADELIRAIESIGSADGQSPAAVKAWLRQSAPPALLKVARGGFEWTVRGDALMALRELDADDAVLREAIEVAKADRSEQQKFIHSRGELLQDWLDGRQRRGSSAAALAPKDAGSEMRGLAVLQERNVRVSAQSLMQAAIEADAEVAQALLDAGVPVTGEGASLAPLAAATSAGCAANRGEIDARLRTIEVLVKGGADPRAADELGNTVLLQAAQMCPLVVVKKLVEMGAVANAKPNAQGVTPLGMAFMGGKWDVAEFLIDSGARTTAKEIDMVFFEKPNDPKALALIKRATQARAAK